MLATGPMPAEVTNCFAGQPDALDVLPTEPPDPDDPVFGAPNLLPTNHSAWYSEAALVTLRRLLAQRCSAYLSGEPVPSLVNAQALAGRSR